MPIDSDLSLLQGISGTRFISDLEKHLDDYDRGKAYLSKSTAAEINRQADANINLDPNYFALYSQYSTGFSYASNAYLTHAVYDVRKTLKVIQEAPKKAEESTAAIKKSLGYA